MKSVHVIKPVLFLILQSWSSESKFGSNPPTDHSDGMFRFFESAGQRVKVVFAINKPFHVVVRSFWEGATALVSPSQLRSVLVLFGCSDLLVLVQVMVEITYWRNFSGVPKQLHFFNISFMLLRNGRQLFVSSDMAIEDASCVPSVFHRFSRFGLNLLHVASRPVPTWNEIQDRLKICNRLEIVQPYTILCDILDDKNSQPLKRSFRFNRRWHSVHSQYFLKKFEIICLPVLGN